MGAVIVDASLRPRGVGARTHGPSVGAGQRARAASTGGTEWTPSRRAVYRRPVLSFAAARRFTASALLLGAAGCTTIDPGPNFVVPDEQYDADFFFCRVEPEVLFAKRCGPGDPAAGDPPNGCHFNASAVSGMAITDHAPIDCDGDRPRNRAQLGAGSPAQANLQAVSLVMSRDVATAPLFLRATGKNHPRQIFSPEDPVVEVIRQWAQK